MVTMVLSAGSYSISVDPALILLTPLTERRYNRATHDYRVCYRVHLFGLVYFESHFDGTARGHVRHRRYQWRIREAVTVWQGIGVEISSKTGGLPASAWWSPFFSIQSS